VAITAHLAKMVLKTNAGDTLLPPQCERVPRHRSVGVDLSFLAAAIFAAGLFDF